MSSAKLGKNLTLQTIYQIVITITPLITAPYLSRVLRPEGLGICSYTQSLVNYFVLFAMLGFVNYGTRSIASANNKKERSRLFWEIFILQLITSILSTILFIIFSFLNGDNRIFLLLQSFWVIGCIFDITWYFFGKEEFKTTVIRNLIIKLLTIISIFVFVKTQEDVGKYIFILSFGSFISQIVLWPKLLKEIHPQKIKIQHCKKHIKPVLLLFVPILAMSIYCIMDKTMLGALDTPEQSGYYYNSDKIVNIPLGIITGIGTVMLAKISAEIAQNGNKRAVEIIKKTMKILLLAAVALAFGIAAISDDFIPFFFGEGYETCITLVKIFAIILVLKSISNIVRTQYLIPFKKEKIYITSVIVGAIINIIANYILIALFHLGALGATIGTLITELLVTILELILIKKYVSFNKEIIRIIPYSIIGIVMFAIITAISALSIQLIPKLILEILIGAFVYMVLGYYYLNFFDKESKTIIQTTLKGIMKK